MVANNKTETFGERISQLLHEHKETPADLARVCGVSRQTAWKWANDKASVPDDDHIAKMARHWRKSAAFIRYGDSSSTPPSAVLMEYDGDLMKAVIVAAKRKLSDLNVVLTPEIEGELIDVLYRNFATRHAVDEDMISQVVSLVGAGRKK